MERYHEYKELFENYLMQRSDFGDPESLYDPVDYILNLDGKRFRPVLLLMAADNFNGIDENALKAAYAVEMFHNFTLVHDDIMDGAELRRGAMTVHKKFDPNTAILSGDVMLILSCELMYSVALDSGKFRLYDEFLKVSRQICEGQQYDMTFERMDLVSHQEYIKMIRLKTAVLLGYSLFAGAYLAGEELEDAASLFDFGTQTGIAFQIWDDYLDVFGTNATGKKTAGDIFNKKETYLIVQLRQNLNEADAKIFEELWAGKISTRDCDQIIRLMEQYEIDQLTQDYCDQLIKDAVKELQSQVSDTKPYEHIIEFTHQFISRKK